MSGKDKPFEGDVATNRNALRSFEIVEKMEAGVVLVGTEVKALREGKAQLNDGYAAIEDGQVVMRGVNIPHYGPASRENHEPTRARRLLMHRYEIDRLIGRSQRKGLTLVPLRIYFKGPRAKVELALVKGKEHRDRRREIKDRDIRREVERDHAHRMR